MRKVIFGGFLLVSGAILFAVGMLGVADTAVRTNYMVIPQYIGAAVLLAGAILSIVGLREEK